MFNYMLENNVTACPLDKPFVIKGTTECVNCEGDTPIFDVDQEICINCPQGTTFNSSVHKCAEEIVECEGGK